MSDAVAIVRHDSAGLSADAIDSAASAPTAWSDWVGMIASIGCAIHCAAMPFVIAYLPALGLSFLADEAFHKWMAAGCFLIAIIAFLPGIRQHGRWTPVAIASVGLVMISVAAFGFAGECCPSCEVAAEADGAVCTDEACTLCETENHVAPSADSEASATLLTSASQPSAPWVSRVVPWLTPVGGLVLVSAHLLNRRYGCLCGCCNNESAEEHA